jgi:nucleobase:cation symporter-1, NCS1 family
MVATPNTFETDEPTDVWVSHPVTTAIERRGFDYIREADRYLTVRSLTGFWVGANAYILYISIGGLALAGGLSLRWGLVAILLGNAFWAVVAWASIGGARSGLPTMTFIRAPFGVRASQFHAFLSWIVGVGFEIANTLLGVFGVLALFTLLGWDSGALGKVLATALVIGVSAYIAIVGHRLTMWVQRFFAVALTLVLVIVFISVLGKVHWSAPAAHHFGGGAQAGIFLAAVAVVASGPLSWFYNIGDYPRYCPSRTSSGRLFSSCFFGAGGISLFICILGAMLASITSLADPVGGVRPVIPGWLYALYVPCAIGGAISNNIAAFYSSGLGVQGTGIRIARYQATAIDVTISTALVLYVLFVKDFTTELNDFLVLILIWLVPFGGVWLTDGLIRRWRYDPEAIHSTAPTGLYYGWHGIKLPAAGALVAGLVVALLTINTPAYQGWISSHWLHDGDLSWVAPLLVSSGLYWLLAHRQVRAESKEARLELDAV